MQLGTIQGINIYIEEKTEDVWFEDDNQIEWMSLRNIKKRNFKIAGILRHNKYRIEDANTFANELEKLLMTNRKVRNEF